MTPTPPTKYTVTTRNVDLYTVRFRGKTKTFQRKDAIQGWIAKQAMLPIFDEYLERYGDVGEDDGNGHPLGRNVFDDWRYLKAKFIEWMADGLEYAEQKLRDYFENDWC